MMTAKFIRFKDDIVNINDISVIWFNESSGNTMIRFINGERPIYNFSGDVRNELWALIKLAAGSSTDKIVEDNTHPFNLTTNKDVKATYEYYKKDSRVKDLTDSQVKDLFDAIQTTDVRVHDRYLGVEMRRREM